LKKKREFKGSENSWPLGRGRKAQEKLMFRKGKNRLKGKKQWPRLL